MRFHSSMLSAAKISVATLAPGPLAPGLFFATPNTGEYSAVIYDNSGSPVWISARGEATTDFRVQQYQGKPVLTFWSGKIDNQVGNGQGHGVILDAGYNKIAEVDAGNGMLSDLHEFQLTARGTALVTVYPATAADLTSVGGPAQGWMYDCHIQEIDVATNELLLDWVASKHIGLDESYQPLGSTGSDAATPYDPYHLNAISADTDSTLLLSARHTHTVYSIQRSSGDIAWRLGGKKSDFAVAEDAAFAWQHHARRQSSSQISLFDNHTLETTGSSRGLLLTVDEQARTATVAQQYTRPGHLGNAMGSTQILGNGNVLVGWGTQNAATEFSADGTALWEASALGSNCYRVARSEWTGRPTTAPDIAVDASGGTLTVHASWNGATEVATWRVLTGNSASALGKAVEVARSGFETSTTTGLAGYVQVLALDAAGAILGRSRVVAL
ncbi:Arylsulfotransferase (ASST) [Propionibacterium cyclohexanicum]|uniref:Arylsulfotransferase (ASST) n=1 Tax=Propionibacterium cyclohexanicum TaxID=64702 RepID=A0A1H9TUM2_9ACTN|nr:Arylsulfotransferase (ASST) [Propionibacterium cyclohexanicum]